MPFLPFVRNVFSEQSPTPLFFISTHLSKKSYICHLEDLVPCPVLLMKQQLFFLSSWRCPMKVCSVRSLVFFLLFSAAPVLGATINHNDCTNGCRPGVNSCNNCCDSHFKPCFDSCRKDRNTCSDKCNSYSKYSNDFSECLNACQTKYTACENNCEYKVIKSVSCPDWVPEGKCPYNCQIWNPASRSCVGAPMNGCN